MKAMHFLSSISLQSWCQEVYDSTMLERHAHAGTLTQEGQIACECKQCRPGGVVKTPSVSCSEFEEHAGSRERRPAESIYLECIAISLKVLHAALRPASSEGPACQSCPSFILRSSPFNRPCTCLGLLTIISHTTVRFRDTAPDSSIQ